MWKMKNKYLHTRNQEVREDASRFLLNTEESLIICAALCCLLTSCKANMMKFTIQLRRLKVVKRKRVKQKRGRKEKDGEDSEQTGGKNIERMPFRC